MRWNLLVSCLVTSMLVAAGCIGDSHDETKATPRLPDDVVPSPAEGRSNTSDPVRDTGLAGEAIDLVDCTFAPIAFTAPRPAVEGLLPEGYQPRGPAPEIVQVNLHLIGCAHYSMGNSTIGTDLSYAEALVRVDPPDSAANGTDLHFFVIETFISDARLANVLSEHGVPAVEGSVEWARDDTSYKAVVRNGEQDVYTVTTGYAVGEQAPETLIQRNHGVTGAGAAAWLDFNEVVQMPTWPVPAFLETGDGALAGIWGAGSPAIAGIVEEGTLSATITFGTAEER